jgi:hypothetical protein
MSATVARLPAAFGRRTYDGLDESEALLSQFDGCVKGLRGGHFPVLPFILVDCPCLSWM